MEGGGGHEKWGCAGGGVGRGGGKCCHGGQRFSERLIWPTGSQG